jgi:hypothetical protein
MVMSSASRTRPLANAIREERAITPAAEWLVDNFHIVDEQLREIRDDLPTGFYRQLPKLSEGALGTGDWNDGMNEVGAAGRGESVWLGWFLHTVLSTWATQ